MGRYSIYGTPCLGSDLVGASGSTRPIDVAGERRAFRSASHASHRRAGDLHGETWALAARAEGTLQFFAAACETSKGSATARRGYHATISAVDLLGAIAPIMPRISPVAGETRVKKGIRRSLAELQMSPARIPPYTSPPQLPMAG
jgi:hypothetical protein